MFINHFRLVVIPVPIARTQQLCLEGHGGHIMSTVQNEEIRHKIIPEKKSLLYPKAIKCNSLLNS